MFYHSKIEHTLRLSPHLLSFPLDEATKTELENIFLDKVIANLGLCISVYDISEIEGGFIYPGEGAATHMIIAAQLKESDAEKLSQQLEASLRF